MAKPPNLGTIIAVAKKLLGYFSRTPIKTVADEFPMVGGKVMGPHTFSIRRPRPLGWSGGQEFTIPEIHKYIYRREPIDPNWFTDLP